MGPLPGAQQCHVAAAARADGRGHCTLLQPTRLRCERHNSACAVQPIAAWISPLNLSAIGPLRPFSFTALLHRHVTVMCVSALCRECLPSSAAGSTSWPVLQSASAQTLPPPPPVNMPPVFQFDWSVQSDRQSHSKPLQHRTPMSMINQCANASAKHLHGGRPGSATRSACSRTHSLPARSCALCVSVTFTVT